MEGHIKNARERSFAEFFHQEELLQTSQKITSSSELHIQKHS